MKLVNIMVPSTSWQRTRGTTRTGDSVPNSTETLTWELLTQPASRR